MKNAREGGEVQHSPVHHPGSLFSRIFFPSIYSLGWYVCSIGLTIFNKWFFTTYGFHYPVFTTCFHSFGIALFSRILFRVQPSQAIPWGVYLRYVVPVGIFAGLDIALSNLSLLFITVTLYTMVKASVVVWVLMFSFIFGLEKPSKKLIMVIVLVASGILLASYGDTKFDPFGFLLIFVASVLAGARWTSCQFLMQHEQFQLDAKTTIYFVAPIQGSCLIPIFFFLEYSHIKESGFFHISDHNIQVLGFMLAALFLAFGLNLFEFLLIHRTSTLTMSIVGTLKEMITIVISVLVFHDEVTALNATGFSICMVGIIGYKVMRYKKLKQSMGHANAQSVEMKELSQEGDRNSPIGNIQSIIGRLTKRHPDNSESPDTEQRQGLIPQDGESDGSEFEEIEIDFHDLAKHTRR